MESFTQYTTREGLAGNLLTALGEDRDGRLWAATQGGVRVLERGRFRDLPGLGIPDGAVVQAIFRDRHGTLWLGSSRGLWRYDNGKSTFLSARDGLVNDDVRVIADGPSGDLWIGGYGG